MDVKDKIVIVTGASSGIGEATARLLSEKGAKVALVARDGDKLSQISGELLGSKFFVADMSKEEEVKNMIQKVQESFGRIDILINNAGQGYGSPVAEIDIEKFRYIFNLNVVGPLVAMQAVIPIMKKRDGGVIINISSGTSVMYLPNLAAYSSTKRALNGITLTARAELEDDNIIVSVIHPYITATNFYKNTLKNETAGGGHFQPRDGMPEADTSEHVAAKILETIQSGEAEVYANDQIPKNA